ncbi:MAG TPA: tRNA (adenosine(37)-N6)-threonylcarbamoyltransferase complex ATPase subunit type 1 TsaE [Pirellulaceae bacterium]|nr:tRNA (adenosine(37)-N6)-threonylcarbamoyltransferase complex ATPase subunit type 1 TsaE [Pirellulaceae bacterium]
MSRFTFTAVDVADTVRLGAALAELLPDSTVIALCGTLGAGKTRLVQAVAVGCGIAVEDVVSPTFTLCQEYRGRRAINHFDAYRLRDDDEFLELGPDEYFDAPALTFVEWGDRVLGCLPRERLEIHIEVTGETARTFEIIGTGKLAAVVNELAQRLTAAE